MINNRYIVQNKFIGKKVFHMPYGVMFSYIYKCALIFVFGWIISLFSIFSLPCSRCCYFYSIAHKRRHFEQSVYSSFPFLCCCSSSISLSACSDMAYCVRLQSTQELIVFGVTEIKLGMECQDKWDFRASRMSEQLNQWESISHKYPLFIIFMRSSCIYSIHLLSYRAFLTVSVKLYEKHNAISPPWNFRGEHPQGHA